MSSTRTSVPAGTELYGHHTRSGHEWRLAGALLCFFLVSSSAPDVALLRHPVHDTFSELLPLRAWTSQMLRHGDWPLWYPYTRYGFPTTTLQLVANFFNPLGLVLGWLVPYDIWTLQLENTIWRAIGMGGCLLYARQHVRSPLGAVVVACCYMGSGLVVPSTASRTIFPTLALAPWLLYGLHRAQSAVTRAEWCRATGVLALAGAAMVWSGYPGIWMTAPFLMAPYGVVLVAGKREAMWRLIACAAVAGMLALALSSLFIADTITFPLFGDSARNAASPRDGMLLLVGLQGLWFVNPSHAPGLTPDSLQPMYLGLVVIALFWARCSVWSRVRSLRPREVGLVVLVGGGLLAASAGVWDFRIAGVEISSFHAFAFSTLLFAWLAFPRQIGKWTRLDAALLVGTLTGLGAATENPVGDSLRAHVPPFTLVRWNWIYMWVAALAMPLLAWRATEAPDGARDPNDSLREQEERDQGPIGVDALWVPVAATCIMLGLAAYLAPPVLSTAGTPYPERIGLFGLMWWLAIMAAGTVLVWWASRGQRLAHHLASVTRAAALGLLGALVALRFAAGVEGEHVRAFVQLPANGRLLLDVAQQAAVLGWLGILSVRGLLNGGSVSSYVTTMPIRASALGLVMVLDIGLAGPRYMSDNAILVSGQGTASVPASGNRDATWAGREDERRGSAELARGGLEQIPSLWVYPETVPSAAALDLLAGEPSIFKAFGQFPGSWRIDNDHAVTVDPLKLRTVPEAEAQAASETEHGDSRPSNCAPGSNARDTQRSLPNATVTRLGSSEVRMHVRADCDRLLVYTDTWAAGWQARVDGEATRVLRVNGVLRGLMIPAGEHTVDWRYRPPHSWLHMSLMAGAGAAVVALLLGPLLVSYVSGPRRPTTSSEPAI